MSAVCETCEYFAKESGFFAQELCTAIELCVGTYAMCGGCHGEAELKVKFCGEYIGGIKILRILFFALTI